MHINQRKPGSTSPENFSEYLVKFDGAEEYVKVKDLDIDSTMKLDAELRFATHRPLAEEQKVMFPKDHNIYYDSGTLIDRGNGRGMYIVELFTDEIRGFADHLDERMTEMTKGCLHDPMNPQRRMHIDPEKCNGDFTGDKIYMVGVPFAEIKANAKNLDNAKFSEKSDLTRDELAVEHHYAGDKANDISNCINDPISPSHARIELDRNGNATADYFPHVGSNRDTQAKLSSKFDNIGDTHRIPLDNIDPKDTQAILNAKFEGPAAVEKAVHNAIHKVVKKPSTDNPASGLPTFEDSNTDSIKFDGPDVE